MLLLARGAGAADWSPQKAAEIERMVERFLKHQGDAVPAMSVAVGVDGELRLAKGFGSPGAGRPVGAGTVYHIGSLTKQFTAAAVLHIVDSGVRAPLSQGRLTLDTPMREIFDGVERWSARDEPPITLRSLLSMTSNLPNFTLHPPREVDPWGAVAMPKLLAALKQLPPHGWPNTFEYSNTSYFLLARAIDAVLADEGVRASSRDYVRDNILRPARLLHTGFVGENVPGVDIAEPHYRRRPAFAQPHWLDGCGDMTSNVLDLFAWNKALMEGRIISAQAMHLMLSDAARVDPVIYYGMGWFITHDEGWDSYYHSGSVPGYTAYNAIQRHEDGSRWMSVTLLTNSDGIEDLDRLADEIFSLLRGA
jgi:CubicO group peptidase (beta-lactamase class C family)